MAPTGELVELMPPFEMELIPLTDTHLLGRSPFSRQWRSVVLYVLPDGPRYLHDGARAMAKVT